MIDFTLSGPEWFDSIPDPVIWGVDHRVAYLNPAAASLAERNSIALEIGSPVPRVMDSLLPSSETALDWLGQHWIAHCRNAAGGLIYCLDHVRSTGLSPERLAQFASRLRNPLNNLFASIHQLELEDQPPEKIAQWRAMERRNSHRMVRIVDSLECMDELGGDLIPQSYGVLDFGGLCVKTVRAVSSFSELTICSIMLEKRDGNYLVRGDEFMLFRLMYHLICNAMQAAGQGGSVNLRLDRRGPMLRLIISDSGPGFSPVALSGAFDPTFVSGNVFDGLGLGIPICHSVVRRHGGRIALVGGPGGMVIVELPLCSNAEKITTSGQADPYKGNWGAMTQLSEILPWQVYLENDEDLF